jgi:hypothetical protein
MRMFRLDGSEVEVKERLSNGAIVCDVLTVEDYGEELLAPPRLEIQALAGAKSHRGFH